MTEKLNYEIVFLIALWICIRILEFPKVIYFFHQINGTIFPELNGLPNGVRFKLFLFHYLVFRFIIEFIKPVNTFLFRLSLIQIACILGIGYYSFLLLRFYLKKCILWMPFHFMLHKVYYKVSLLWLATSPVQYILERVMFVYLSMKKNYF